MREIRPYGSVRGVRRKPYPYRDMLNPMRSSVLFVPGSTEARMTTDAARPPPEGRPAATTGAFEQTARQPGTGFHRTGT